MDDKREQLNNVFPSNSKTQKPDASRLNHIGEKKVEKVISGSVTTKKRGIGRRIADTFFGDDTKSVGNYVFNDILIPAAKAMISDMVGGGIEMLLFGDRRGRGSSRRDDNRRGTITNYGGMSRGSDRGRDIDSRDRGREMSQTARARHDFDDITYESRGEADLVLSHLVDLTEDYQQATVADFYDLVGLPKAYTDDDWGWYDLSRVDKPRRIRNGRYILELPRPQPLD